MIRNLFIASLLLSTFAIDILQDQFEWPGWPEHEDFKTWSGYIPVGNDPDTRDLHYVFIESASDTKDDDPIILWLNGGPGCSSMLGLMQEIGPFVIDNGETQFKPNEWSWNTKAHLLFLESPSGVGFSRAPQDPAFAYTDVQVGADNYKAIRTWFDTFTYYRGRPFWIAGESYAGMYVPYTAKTLIEQEANVPDGDKINIKGVLIGNGVLVMDDKFRDQTANSFLTRRNFIDSTNQFILNHQCAINPESASCILATRALNKAMSELNPYGVYSYCWGDSTTEKLKRPHSTRFPYTPWLKVSEEGDNNAPCLDFGPLNNELNKDDVKQALHVDTQITWEACSDTVGEKYQRNPEGSYKILPYLNQHNLKILVYSGDQDLAVSMVETYKSIQMIPGITELKEWTAYANSNTGSLIFDQLAGWVTEYDILTYWVIRGAGHMVPQDQRENAWFMLDSFINRQ